MFGYIRISKPELKIKEYELYKAVYCSLCKYMGKKYGIFSRFTLSYDFTFTSLLSMSLSENCDNLKNGRCIFNPLKKCRYVSESSDLELSAAASLIISKYKLKDDIIDGSFFKKTRARLLSIVFGKAFKKAEKEYPLISFAVKEYTKSQLESETQKNKSLDYYSEPTAGFLSSLLPLLTDNKEDKRVLKELGKLLGRYIYILDAIDDYSDDMKNGNFNPFANLTYEEAKNKAKQICYICINQAIPTFELLNIKKYKDILGNIIYVGLEDTLISVINKENSKK